ncbi:hypothetical protein CQ13_03650 [Bradyrhizobium retamae]|uniref:Uncharacterized protein n=2 Tax=Bradyrhizobium retamae TaxID=1300035 RepID=A0A0R3N5Q6_9BRAD|nr:hypothetical protein CQ13_03650 [Bradyrhizobium retamae]
MERVITTVDFFLQAEALNHANQALLRSFVLAGMVNSTIQKARPSEREERRVAELNHRQDNHRAVWPLATQRIEPPVENQ